MLGRHAYDLRSLVVAVLVGVVTLSSANAQIIVLQSTIKQYKPGYKIRNADNVTIPEGQSLVVVLPSGVTRKIQGPFNAIAGDLAKASGQLNIALFKAVENYIRTGGSTSSSIGALRSVGPRPVHGGVDTEIPFSWSTVHVRKSGDVCIDKNASVTVMRSRTIIPQSVTFVDFATKQKAEIVFPAGVDSMPWPAEMELKNGSYGILTKGSRLHQVRVRLINSAPDPGNVLQVLHGQRCMQQFKAYLRDVAKTDVTASQQSQ